jgi:predicted transcriptional regulator
MTGIKQAILELAKSLPDDCTWDDVMYRLYVRQKIEAGLKDADQGRVVSHEEVFKEWPE